MTTGPIVNTGPVLTVEPVLTVRSRTKPRFPIASHGAKALVVVVVVVVVVAGAVVMGGLSLRGQPAGEEASTSSGPQPVVPDGVGNTKDLSPEMARAIDRAISAAAAQGVELRVTSGWRGHDEQRRLYEAAIVKYGSPAQARWWVLPPAESAHVQGRAVDVGPASGARWLEEHGVHFGLCRRYDNEPWHFERLAGAKGSVCPQRKPHA